MTDQISVLSDSWLGHQGAKTESTKSAITPELIARSIVISTVLFILISSPSFCNISPTMVPMWFSAYCQKYCWRVANKNANAGPFSQKGSNYGKDIWKSNFFILGMQA
jgi:hypothetical protein